MSEADAQWKYFIKPREFIEVEAGGSLFLSCSADGDPSPTIRWKKGNSEWLTPKENAPLVHNPLELNNIQKSGRYTCEVTNGIHTSEATVFVKVRSNLVAPKNVQISDAAGTSVHLSWTYDNPDDLLYFSIRYKESYTQDKAEKEIPAIKDKEFTLTGLTPETFYEIQIVAIGRDDDEAASKPINIRTPRVLTEAPPAPTDLASSNVTDTDADLQWKLVSKHLPSYFVIVYKLKDSEEEPQEISDVRDIKYTLTGLSPTTAYEVQIAAVNEIGRGPPSDPIYFTTTVEPKAKFSPPPPRVFVDYGGSVTLQCSGKGNPTPTIRWKKGSDWVTEEKEGENNLELTNITDPVSTYTCVGKGEDINFESSTDVVVRTFIPSGPQ